MLCLLKLNRNQHTNLMNNFCCGQPVTLRCCDTALKLCSYLYLHAMFTAMAPLCDGAAQNPAIPVLSIFGYYTLAQTTPYAELTLLFEG